MLIAYVAGPYNGDGHSEIDRHIQEARQVAIELCRMGYATFTPHLNTAHFEVDAGLPEAFYKDMDIEFLGRSDLIVMLPTWEQSRGATAERNRAMGLSIPMFYWPADKSKLAEWVK